MSKPNSEYKQMWRNYLREEKDDKKLELIQGKQDFTVAQLA